MVLDSEEIQFLVPYGLTMGGLCLVLSYAHCFNRAIESVKVKLEEIEEQHDLPEGSMLYASEKLTFVIYMLVVTGIAFGWYVHGWLAGLGSIILCVVLFAFLNSTVMPKSGSKHYREVLVFLLRARLKGYTQRDHKPGQRALQKALEMVGRPEKHTA